MLKRFFGLLTAPARSPDGMRRLARYQRHGSLEALDSLRTTNAANVDELNDPLVSTVDIIERELSKLDSEIFAAEAKASELASAETRARLATGTAEAALRLEVAAHEKTKRDLEDARRDAAERLRLLQRAGLV